MRDITQDIGTVVNRMRDFQQIEGAPFYFFGSRLEISNRLIAMDKDPINKSKKYPLIMLRLDVPELVSDGVVTYTLNIVMAAPTKKTYIAEQRMENVIRPVLMPMYESFFAELKKCRLFMWPYGLGQGEKPKHTRIVRPFWGVTGPEGNQRYIFNDPLDAIEIFNLEVKQDLNKC